MSQDRFKCDPDTQSSKQSLHKVSSEAASCMQMFLKISLRCFLISIAKIVENSFFIENLWWLLFFSLIKQLFSIRHLWTSYQKHNVGWFVLKGFVDLFRLCYIISRNHSICWLTFRKQKLVQSKTLQQGLFVLISDFWQFRYSNFNQLKSSLKIT